MNLIHLSRDDYSNLIMCNHLNNCYHTIVLNNGCAVIVNYTTLNNNVYYEDCIYKSCNSVPLDLYTPLHAELYLKMALVIKFYCIN